MPERSSMDIRCVIFDFDRTLVNLTSFVDWERVRRLIIQTYLEHGVPENLMRQLRRSGLYFLLIKTHEEMLKRLSRNEAQEIQAAVFDVLEKCEAEGAFNSQLMPGCPEALRWLKSKGIKIGIASSNSGEVIKEILSLHDLNPFIDTIVARDVRYGMKPRPDQFLLCMKKVGCKAQNSVAVGDSRRDVEAAKKAGMFAIGILTGLNGREELSAVGSRKIIRSLYELPDTLITLDPSLSS